MSPIIGKFSGQYGFGRGGGGGGGGYGEVVFTKAGSYTWVAPTGVTSVNVVCIGGGGAGGVQWSSGGGGGGGLGWKNNIPVSPGSSYTVVVGAGGSNGVTTSTKTSNAYNSDAMGDNSYFISLGTVAGYGSGRGGSNSNSASPAYGGGYTGDGGGRGGDGAYDGSWNYGGAGAGGYNGAGAGPRDSSSNGANAPSGSGGGGTGGWYSSTYGVPAGGGTGIYGRTNDGAASGSGGGYPNGGYGGSGGGRGVTGENDRASSSGNGHNGFGQDQAQGLIFGGFYGGGGGGSGTSWGGGGGGCGAVRIIWGKAGTQNRSFPANAAWTAPIISAPNSIQLRYDQEAEFLKNIGCPQLWYKNSDIAVLSDGSAINTWQNSGSYGPAMDLVNNYGPYYGGTVTKVTDAGRAAANFAGNQYMRFRLNSALVLYSSSYYQTWSVFVVYRDYSGSNNFGFLSNYGANGSPGTIGMSAAQGTENYINCHNNDGFAVNFGFSGDNNWIQRGIISSSSNSNNQSEYSFSDNGATRTASGYYSQGTGDNNLYYFDGYGTNRTSPYGGPTSNGSGYGAHLSVSGIGSTRYTANNGYISELIWFDRALNDAESTAVRKYLNVRFSV